MKTLVHRIKPALREKIRCAQLGMDVTTYEFKATTYTATSEASRELGHKHYEISNHLGNVLSVISDQKRLVVEDSLVVSCASVVLTATDYYPFGVGLYGRSWSEGYRYGFNGKERDNSTASDSYDFGARILDTRLGRWLSLDFLSSNYPSLSPFNACGNNPLFLIDPDGHQIIPVGDHRGNASAQQSSQMLAVYFTTAFGAPMANVLMSSMNNGKLGAFRPSGSREAFVNAFSTELSNINDEFAKTLAIGVYEAIMSNETISFIGYAGDQGAETATSTPRGGDPMACSGPLSQCENYFSDEQMVGGTPSLSQLKSGVDVLYDPLGPGGIIRNIDCGLVAVSDPLLINTGSLPNPDMASSFGATPAGVITAALNVVEQIASTNRVLNEVQPTMTTFRTLKESPSTAYTDRQGEVRSHQNFFRQITQQASNNLIQPATAVTQMTRQQRKTMGERYNPKKQNFSSDDGK